MVLYCKKNLHDEWKPLQGVPLQRMHLPFGNERRKSFLFLHKPDEKSLQIETADRVGTNHRFLEVVLFSFEARFFINF